MGQILIKKPITTNGRDPLMKGGSVQYKETIVEDSARTAFERQNKTKPEHLKLIIEDYDPETRTKKTKEDDKK